MNLFKRHESIISAFLYFTFEGLEYRAAIYQGEVQYFSVHKKGWYWFDKAVRWRLIMSKLKTRELMEHLDNENLLGKAYQVDRQLSAGIPLAEIKGIE